MLSPEYLDSMSDAILAIYDALNETVVEDIARRIVKTGIVTESAEFQANQILQMGALYDDVLQRVSDVSGYSQTELRKLFEDAGIQNIKYENDIMSKMGLMPFELKQSETMMQILQAGLDKTGRDLSNLTLTTAIRAQNTYYQATNLAYMQVSSGTFSYQEAIKRAVISTAKDGATVLYPSGHSDKVDVAVRRAVLTGVNQTAAKISLAYCEEADCDLVETTAHSGARPSHMEWQGRVFSRSGKHSKYPSFDETGYGTGEGLCGWNCRHSFHAYFEGYSKPAYTKAMLDDYSARKYEYEGQKLTDYECSQMQRSQERRIRETRRQLTACNSALDATNDEALKNKLQMEFSDQSVRLKNQEAELKDFCKQTHRRVDSARLQVHAVKDDNGRIIGFNKSVSQKAVHSNKNTIEKYSQYRYNKDGTIKVTDDWTQSTRKKIPANYRPFAVIETVEIKKGVEYHNRTIYDKDGQMSKQIHSGPHANPKQHPYGSRGEHAHDYEWAAGKISTRITRELTESERKENGDIL